MKINMPTHSPKYSRIPYPFSLLKTISFSAGNDFSFGFNTQDRVDEISGSGNHYIADSWKINMKRLLFICLIVFTCTCTCTLKAQSQLCYLDTPRDSKLIL